MESISIRYGQDVSLPVSTEDPYAVSASLYVGKPGEAYIIRNETAIIDGEGIFIVPAEDTRVPLGSYKYQINVTDTEGRVEKYPSPVGCGDCEDDLPNFIVCESIDEIEVS